MIPNLAHLDGFPREDGVCGNWFMPQCVPEYSTYVDTISTEENQKKKKEVETKNKFIDFSPQKDTINDLPTEDYSIRRTARSCI